MSRLLRHGQTPQDRNGTYGGGNSGFPHDATQPPPSHVTPRIRRQHTDPEVASDNAALSSSSHYSRILPSSRVSRGVSAPDNHSNGGSNLAAESMPTGWRIADPVLRHTDPLSISMNSSPKVTVYANRSVPRSLLQQSAASAGAGVGAANSWRRQSNESSPLYPSLALTDHNNPNASNKTFGSSRGGIQVYYFEVTVICHSHPAATVEVSVGFFCDRETFGAWPGELPNSIGWGTDGLYVNGHVYNDNATPIRFTNGDNLGVGFELASGRVFFTRNNSIIVPPSSATVFMGTKDASFYPVVSFRHGNGDVLKGNFGLDPRQPFCWSGSERLTIVSAQPAGGDSLGRRSSSFGGVVGSSFSGGIGDNLSASYRSQDGHNSDLGSSRRPPSPYYSISGLDRLDSRLDSPPLSTSSSTSRMNNPEPILTRSARSTTGGRYGTPSVAFDSTATIMDGGMPGNVPPPRPSYFGTKNSRNSLVDDDPNEASNATGDHFNLHSSATTSSTALTSGWAPTGTGPNLPQRAPSYSVEASETAVPRRNASGSELNARRQNRREERAARRARQSHKELAQSGGSSSNRTGGSSPLSGGSHTASNRQNSGGSPSLDNLPAPRSNFDSSPMLHTVRKDSERRPSALRPGAVAVASGDVVRVAKENSQSLLKASQKKELDIPYVKEQLEACKADQERLQLKLNHALEEADAIDNLEELFAVNDGICSAIEAAKEALKRAKEKAKKRKTLEGPTIELLVENEDVFSLICMLRAPNEKRLAAALALMKFARENEILRNEIRSSGGMHSFLTLFRTKGTTRELQVVASLAVAYVLPSFVASSQTSSAVGLKIVECLRFLVTSHSVSPQNVLITRQEMCKAASVGVNVMWINAIQPLIALEKAKSESQQSRPTLRPSTSVRFGRMRGRTGGGVFDQGQESIEIQELTELAVTLIAHISKLTDQDDLRLEIGYNIVEQVCEVDAARPIAVREGLLRVLVDWIRSQDVNKVRPAASALRYLISIKDKYMAGWIHSQVVNEGAVGEIVKLLNESVGHDVRVAVAQMLSALCVAPHTRAAVVEAECVSYLVALLYEHNASASADMVHHAGTALLQLAAGAMTRASAVSGNSLAILDSSAPDKQETVVDDIIEGWAHGSFVQIALEHKGKLRSVAVEALRVLSEDTSTTRQTRLQLCNAGAAEALGKTLKDDAGEIEPLKHPERYGAVFHDAESPLYPAVKVIHEALCGLGNIFEPQKEPSKASLNRRHSSAVVLSPKEMLIKGCMDIVKSGGLGSLIWISTLPYSQSPLAESGLLTADRMDLLDETCRLLANISPLLLTDVAASNGCASWASDVFEALDGILSRLNDGDGDSEGEAGAVPDAPTDLNIDALRGIGALAQYEPLKIRIVDKSLAKLLLLKSMSGERNDLSNAANQVLLSLGFTEDEITVQVAGNNPKLLVDWFCLQRALMIQAMARSEMRARIMDMWQAPFADTDAQSSMKLIRQLSVQSNLSSGSGDEKSTDSQEPIKDLFENFTNDSDSLDGRQAIIEQYSNVYEPMDGRRSGELNGRKTVNDSGVLRNSLQSEESSLMSPHVFPLNDTTVEKDWILSHRRLMDSNPDTDSDICSVGVMPERIEKLLDCCFPSKLLRNDVVPINDLRPQSSFNFRALMMPQRRYFSFRREGQLLARLCEKQAAALDSDEVHWTLGFTNSTFAGEFVESLVQTLYLCPMITGLSFARNSEWIMVQDTDKESDGDDGGGLLANLAGSLPPWVSFLTFDSILNDRDLRALVAILDTMGKLSSGFVEETEAPMSKPQTSRVSSVGQYQGKFNCVSIRNSPQITRESWLSFFKMLGKSGPAKRAPASMPLSSSLKVLDLSGNKLGDETSALVLELVHDKDSGCSLEQLDLSGNRIGRGTNVVKVLRAYTEYYRYNQKLGVKMVRKSWKSTLHTLVLAENDLFLGQAGLEIFALLKHNALCLRYLDLSNNGLEGDTYQLLASSLLKNTSLCHLNLSGNKFSAPLIDLILGHLNGPDAESGLSFFLLQNNVPALNENQLHMLGSFLRRSRKNAIERFVKDRDRGAVGESVEFAETSDRPGGDLELIDEASQSHLFRNSFQTPRQLRQSTTVDSFGGTDDEGENMITVLFSAPLVFAGDDNRLHPFAKLDFDMERELLWQCMKEASRDIEVSFDTAHHSRLLATLTKRCSCLHYSGHGHANFLPFEDGMGGPNWLNVQDIKELIVRDGVAPFKFVFVSACHSGLAGETFASAGVPHVVCCRQESELKDTAALAFTRSFYLALAVGQTVKESFEQGCKAVRATPNLRDPESEMEKFVLLPKDGNHDVPVFRAKPVREWPRQPRNQLLSSKSRRRGSLMRMRSVMALGAKSSELSVRNMMQEDPSPTAPQFFLGREVDMYYILTTILKMKKRLVSVLGETGIGRSSLVCALCHYINERASTITEVQRVYFIKPKHGGRNVSCRSLLRQLLDKLEEAGKCRPTDEDTDTEAMLDTICKSLKNDRALIVFDRTELLEKSDESQELPMILSTLLYDTKQVKVLLTGRHSLGQPSIGGQVEHPHQLKPLNFANTVKLFANLCPHLHTPSERARLFKRLTGDCDEDQAELYPGDALLDQRSRHILSRLGDGVPAKIEKAAYSISKDDLQQLQTDSDNC